MTTPTPRTDGLHAIACVASSLLTGPRNFSKTELKGFANELHSARVQLERDLAAAQEELRAIGDHVGGGAFYRNEHGGRLPLRDQVGQHIAELNQQLAAAQEARQAAEAALAKEAGSANHNAAIAASERLRAQRAEARAEQMEGLLLLALYHHQGGSSAVGQPIRKFLGMGQHDYMTDEQIERGKAAGRAAHPKDAP